MPKGAVGQLNVRVPRATLDRTRALAHADGLTLALIVDEALNRYFEEHPSHAVPLPVPRRLPPGQAKRSRHIPTSFVVVLDEDEPGPP